MDAKDEKPGGDSSELSPSQGQTAIPVSSSEAENGTDPKSNAQDKFAAASASTSDTISIKTNSIRENQSADARPFNVLGKYLYNSNPFYAISAAFVLLGLHYVFHDEAAVLATTAVDFNSWLLLGVIAGYCAILAATALVIVRLGKVWDDARTILCTLLLVLVALSVNFDKLALTNPVTFIKVLSLGLVFAVGLVEFMLKSLGIRMSLWFRVPLHLFLILFFLYPMTLSYFLDEIGGANNQKGYDATLWGILLFPFAAGLVTLSLLPAAQKGNSITQSNGTPWKWPLYPWSAFVILGVGVLLRSYYLTMSFHPRPGLSTAFGPYLVSPFLLAVCVVCFELARSAKNVYRQNAVLFLSLFLILVSQRQLGRIGVPYRELFDMYSERLATPLFTTLLGLLALHIYAWLRGNRFSVGGLAMLVLLSTFIGPETQRLTDFRSIHYWPVFALSAAFLLRAIWLERDSLAWVCASIGVIGSLAIMLRETSFLAYGGAIPLNVLLLSTLFIGTCFRDKYAPWIRVVSLWLIVVICFNVTMGGILMRSNAAPLMAFGYVFACMIVTWLVWLADRIEQDRFIAIVVSVCAASNGLNSAVYLLMSFPNPMGPVLLLCGIVSFAVAALISTRKAAVFRKSVGATPDDSTIGAVVPVAGD